MARDSKHKVIIARDTSVYILFFLTFFYDLPSHSIKSDLDNMKNSLMILKKQSKFIFIG